MPLKPWYPVKPMDPTWLASFAQSVKTLNEAEKMEIDKAFEVFNSECAKASEKLEKALDSMAKGKIKK